MCGRTKIRCGIHWTIITNIQIFCGLDCVTLALKSYSTVFEHLIGVQLTETLIINFNAAFIKKTALNFLPFFIRIKNDLIAENYDKLFFQFSSHLKFAHKVEKTA